MSARTTACNGAVLHTTIRGKFGKEPATLEVFGNRISGTVSLMPSRQAIVLDAAGQRALARALWPAGPAGADDCAVCGTNPPVATVRERATVRCRSKNILFRTALAIARRKGKARR